MKLEGLVHATVLFPLRPGAEGQEVLLARKTAKIGIGLYNGIGGGVENGETIDQAAVRETQEEVDIVVEPAHLERCALIYCHNYNKRGESFVCKLYVYTAASFSGEPKVQSDSGLRDLAWFAVTRLPLGEMMFGDREWARRVLSGQRLMGEIFYAPGMDAFERPPRMDSVTKETLDRSWTP